MYSTTQQGEAQSIKHKVKKERETENLLSASFDFHFFKVKAIISSLEDACMYYTVRTITESFFVPSVRNMMYWCI